MTNMCHADIIAFYQQKITGILNYYSFAGNRGNLRKIVWVLHQSCALTLALKYKLKTIRGTMMRFGKTLACPVTKRGLVLPGSLRSTHRFNTSAQLSTPETIIKTSWASKLTQTGLGKVCAICGDASVEMHHVRAVKDIRARIRGGKATYDEWAGAFKRKQIPLCGDHHRKYHAGELSREEMLTIANYT